MKDIDMKFDKFLEENKDYINTITPHNPTDRKSFV